MTHEDAVMIIEGLRAIHDVCVWISIWCFLKLVL